MRLLNKETLENYRSKRVQVILDPDTYVCVQPLSAYDLEALRKEFGGEASTDNVRFNIAVAARCVCDDNGNRLDIGDLGDFPFGWFSKIAESALPLSGVYVEQVDDKKKDVSGS